MRLKIHQHLLATLHCVGEMHLKLILGLLVIVSYFYCSESIVLCDGACANASEPLAICDKARSDRSPLAIMGFFPCNTGSFRARALTVAGQMAAAAVRSNMSLLQNYSLEMEFDNTMVRVRVTVEEHQLFA